MNTIFFFIIVIIGLLTSNSVARPPSVCYKLSLDRNRLLQSVETNLKIKRQCSIHPHTKIHTMRRLVKGCYYAVPPKWAEAISYPKLSHTGFTLRHKNPSVSCPTLSFQQFETLTFDGRMEGWKTEQTNTIKRLLRMSSENPPLPATIIPVEELKIGEFMFDQLVVRLVVGSMPIAPDSNFYYDK